MLARLLTKAEYLLLRGLAHPFGISIVVRYLRNPNPELNLAVLRAYGAIVGRGTTVKRTLFLDNVFEDKQSRGDFSHLRIGSNSYLGDAVYLDLANSIQIADNVMVSAKCALLTHSDAKRSPYLERLYPRKCLPIAIEEGVWLGVGVTVMPGVSIGARSVVAPGAVVCNDVQAMSLYAGIPAAKVKAFDPVSEP